MGFRVELGEVRVSGAADPGHSGDAGRLGVRVIEEDAVSDFHLLHVVPGLEVADPVPVGPPVALQIVKAVGLGLALHEPEVARSVGHGREGTSGARSLTGLRWWADWLALVGGAVRLNGRCAVSPASGGRCRPPPGELAGGRRSKPSPRFFAVGVPATAVGTPLRSPPARPPPRPGSARERRSTPAPRRRPWRRVRRRDCG